MSESNGAENEFSEMERLLRAAAPFVVFPPTPDLGPAVSRRLAAAPASRRSAGFAFRQRRFVIAAAAAAVLILVAISSSTARDAVSSLFDLPGIRIVGHDDKPAPTAAPIPDLRIGPEISLDKAAETAPFPLSIANTDIFGEPDEVHLLTSGDHWPIVSFVYLSDDRLPRASESGVGMLLMEFTSNEPTILLMKEVMGDGRITDMSFDGNEAYWVEGSSDLTILVAPADGCCATPARATANVLIWRDDDVTYRLESALSREEAVAIARTVTPLEDS